jgi:hypothetical protein
VRGGRRVCCKGNTGQRGPDTKQGHNEWERATCRFNVPKLEEHSPSSKCGTPRLPLPKCFRPFTPIGLAFAAQTSAFFFTQVIHG